MTISLPNPFADIRAETVMAACEIEFASELLALRREREALDAVAAALCGHLTKQQVRWAAQHDWFRADLGNGLIEVVDRWWSIWSGDEHREVVVWDKSFSELRYWAGY